MKKFLNSKNAFTFIELIVGITITMMLMLSVSLFVQNGIKNITIQKSTLENDVKIKDFIKYINENIGDYDKSFSGIQINSGSSGILLKINKNFEKGGWSYIGKSNIYRLYCQSGSDSIKENTNHIVIKNFIPFEGFGGDIFNSFSGNYFSGTINTNFFSGTINSLSGILIGPTDIAFSGTIGFVSDTLGHSIYQFDTSTLSGFKKIAGSEVFGDEFLDGSNGTGIYLNSPTGLSYSNISGSGYLFISDTLNDRILYLDLSKNKIYKLIGREEGLKEPTGIYYNDNEKTLYIANSGKKEILSYTSSGSFIDSTSLTFKPTIDINNVNKLEFSFLFESGTTNPVITGPTNTGSIDFTPGLLQITDFITGSINKLSYYFSDYFNLVNNNYPCTTDGFFLSGSIDSPYEIKSCNGATGSIYINNLQKVFYKGTLYKININNLTGSSFNNTGSYYIKLGLFSGSTNLKNYYFPHFMKGDQNIFTKKDNILKTITGSLGYPTGIYPNGNNLIFNDFQKREKIEITKTGSFISSGNLNSFNFDNISRNKITDITLYTPIKDYEINITDNILNIFINYYKNYGCYGDENINQTKEFILKKNLN